MRQDAQYVQFVVTQMLLETSPDIISFFYYDMFAIVILYFDLNMAKHVTSARASAFHGLLSNLYVGWHSSH